MRHHISAHLNSSDPWPRDLVKPAEPCGMCGIRSAYGHHLEDPSITAGCPVSLTKHAGTLKTVHQCKLAGNPQYSLQSAGKSVISTPSTNRPMKCPFPACKWTIWSYNAAAHFETRHQGTTPPGNFEGEVCRGVHEVEWCATLLGRRAVPSALACKKYADECACDTAKKRKRV